MPTVALAGKSYILVAGGTVSGTSIAGADIDLADNSTTFLNWIDLGLPARGESWIIPKVSGANAVLASTWDQPALVTINLSLKASSVANLRTIAGTIRDAFNKASKLYVSISGQGQMQTFTTYVSAIPPLLTSQQEADRQLFIATNQFLSVGFQFSVWRQAYADGASVTPTG